ncbi:hypothetical protein K402DRAFT_301820, partial [Aulographum hederae CBS 113979]
LCIVQDEDLLKQPQLEQMGRVYANAIVTIVAAYGTNADAGLLGVRLGSRVFNQRVLELQDSTLISVI